MRLCDIRFVHWLELAFMLCHADSKHPHHFCIKRGRPSLEREVRSQQSCRYLDPDTRWEETSWGHFFSGVVIHCRLSSARQFSLLKRAKQRVNWTTR
jgi:hypothetical protein